MRISATYVSPLASFLYTRRSSISSIARSHCGARRVPSDRVRLVSPPHAQTSRGAHAEPARCALQQGANVSARAQARAERGQARRGAGAGARRRTMLRYSSSSARRPLKIQTCARRPGERLPPFLGCMLCRRPRGASAAPPRPRGLRAGNPAAGDGRAAHADLPPTFANRGHSKIKQGVLAVIHLRYQSTGDCAAGKYLHGLRDVKQAPCQQRSGALAARPTKDLSEQRARVRTLSKYS